MKRIVGVVLLLSLVCSVSGVKAAEKATEGGPDSAAFKDPYNGGDPLCRMEAANLERPMWH
jgi:hypothetical protein